MSGPQLQAPRTSAPVSTIPSGGAEKLPAGDPRKEVAALMQAGEIGQKGTPSGSFMRMVAQASRGMDPALTLRNMPVEMAQAILESRGDAISEFLRAWADNIAENAKRDQEASKRARELKEQLQRPQTDRRSRVIFAASVDRAVNTGLIDNTSGKALREMLNLPQPESNRPVVPPKPDNSAPQRPLLQRPQGVGFKLRP